MFQDKFYRSTAPSDGGLAIPRHIRYNVLEKLVGKELAAVKEAFFETVKTGESSLPERTAGQISRLIAERQLASGDKLPSEFELAELLNVGRGTIREGVKLLYSSPGYSSYFYVSVPLLKHLPFKIAFLNSISIT